MLYSKRGLVRAAALVGVAFVMFGAAACGDDDDDDSGTGITSDAALDKGDGAGERAGAPSAAATTAGVAYLPGSGSGGTSVNQSIERKIIFNTALNLSVPQVEDAFQEVQRLARNAQGYVEKSSLSVRTTDEGQPQLANVTLRVPVTQYDGLIQSLRTLNGAKVMREEANSTEVTEQYTDLQSRLRNLTQTEAQFLRLLEQAGTIEEIITVNDRLSTVRGEIEQTQGRINVLDNLTGLATIDVQLSPIAAAQVKTDSGGIPTVAEAFEGALDFSVDTLRVLAAAGAIAAVLAVWAIPVAVVAFIGRRFVRTKKQPA